MIILCFINLYSLGLRFDMINCCIPIIITFGLHLSIYIYCILDHAHFKVFISSFCIDCEQCFKYCNLISNNSTLLHMVEIICSLLRFNRTWFHLTRYI